MQHEGDLCGFCVASLESRASVTYLRDPDAPGDIVRQLVDRERTVDRIRNLLGQGYTLTVDSYSRPCFERQTIIGGTATCSAHVWKAIQLAAPKGHTEGYW